ncbi:putative methyltransferase-like protein 15 [Galemys pyrenaicus]|uniref:Putative methyltransferase-like protein 15 n=1 Tax=Galemys pyrenaicus TaxID=202257 RepID=A0A8J5ZZZ7_GALPY|nr:putative methyltransferase-like protein 15 [Galemys pyrenaicus]
MYSPLAGEFTATLRHPPPGDSNSATRFKPKPVFSMSHFIGYRFHDVITQYVAAARYRSAARCSEPARLCVTMATLLAVSGGGVLGGRGQAAAAGGRQSPGIFWPPPELRVRSQSQGSGCVGPKKVHVTADRYNEYDSQERTDKTGAQELHKFQDGDSEAVTKLHIPVMVDEVVRCLAPQKGQMKMMKIKRHENDFDKDYFAALGTRSSIIVEKLSGKYTQGRWLGKGTCCLRLGTEYSCLGRQAKVDVGSLPG